MSDEYQIAVHELTALLNRTKGFALFACAVMPIVTDKDGKPGIGAVDIITHPYVRPYLADILHGIVVHIDEGGDAIVTSASVQ